MCANLGLHCNIGIGFAPLVTIITPPMSYLPGEGKLDGLPQYPEDAGMRS